MKTFVICLTLLHVLAPVIAAPIEELSTLRGSDDTRGQGFDDTRGQGSWEYQEKMGCNEDPPGL